ncbi:MAG: DMT family transporter [Actinobacteria bacterium]|nr:DMT family transporter [Actinomycetota bacterium]
MAGSSRLPYATAILGALVIAFSGILFRFADVSASTAAFFRCFYALPFLALLAWREQRRFGPRPSRQRTLALAAGVLFAADLVFWHKSIEAVGAGLATVLGNTQVLFVALLAWLILRERPEARVVIAIPVMIVGLVLISGVVGRGAYGEDPMLGVVLGVLTAIAYSGFILILRQGNRDWRRPAGPLLDATFTAAIFSAVVGGFLGEIDLVPRWPSHGWLLLLAVESQVVGWILISISLPRLPAAVTSILLMIQPVGSMVLGRLLLDETPSVMQIAGVIIILGGVLFATSRRRVGAARPEEAKTVP